MQRSIWDGECWDPHCVFSQQPVRHAGPGHHRRLPEPLGKNQTNYCLALINNFLCSMYLPQCSPQVSVLPICMSVCTDLFTHCEQLSAKDARTTCLEYGVPIADGTPNITCTYVVGATATTSGSATSAFATSLTSSTTSSKHYNNSVLDAPPTNTNNMLVMTLMFFVVSILLQL